MDKFLDMTNSKEIINQAHQSLLIAEKDMVNRYPERLFKLNFLNLFIDPPDEENYHARLNDWLMIAGSPFLRVDIYDEKTKEVLFSVPPIYNSSIINTLSHVRSESFYKVIAEYRLRSDRMVEQGEFFMENKINEKMPNLISKTKNSEDQWAPLLNYYGITENRGVESKQVESIVEYDED